MHPRCIDCDVNGVWTDPYNCHCPKCNKLIAFRPKEPTVVPDEVVKRSDRTFGGLVDGEEFDPDFD